MLACCENCGVCKGHKSVPFPSHSVSSCLIESHLIGQFDQTVKNGSPRNGKEFSLDPLNELYYFISHNSNCLTSFHKRSFIVAQIDLSCRTLLPGVWKLQNKNFSLAGACLASKLKSCFGKLFLLPSFFRSALGWSAFTSQY